MNSKEAKTAADMYQVAIMMAELTIDGFSFSTSESAPDAELATHILYIATTPDGVGMDRDSDIAELLSKYREAVIANQAWKLELCHDEN